MYDFDKDFEQYFPKLNYKLKDFQKRVIENVVMRDNTLCIMPTGGGKSVIYWMSAIELKGIAIVISPLTALIAEQAEKIREHGYEVLELHSGIPYDKQMQILIEFANGKLNPQFIFVSPEKIATDGFFEYCLKCRKDDIRLLVVDEVHCVSQWGLSFRPFYKRIPNFMDKLFGTENWCRVLALTATLNPKELNDICNEFKITNKNIIKQDLLIRSEIQLHVQKFSTEKEKEKKFWDILKIHKNEKILVYLYRKKGERSVEGLCEQAQAKGYRATPFHGDMAAKERMEIINKYADNEFNIIFATNAFGMGIDIPDIRVVIHFMLPESAEQYYQEVGRAARDHKGANAYLLYTNKNIEVKRTHFIDKSFPSEQMFIDVYKKIANKPGVKLLSYFEDEEIQLCLPYFLEVGLIEIIGKGFSELKYLTDINNPVVRHYYDSTKSKGYCLTMKKSSVSAEQLSSDVYSALVQGDAKVSKPLSRWLVIKVNDIDISPEKMDLMINSTEMKKNYKRELLDYFVHVLENNSDNKSLHQEIAMYLGMEKHNLAKIYETTDGNHVRSKSEVIIANMLHSSGLQYKYEEKLYYDENKWIEPDFTIILPSGEKIFWEHVGMLGKEDYDKNWLKKIDIYTLYYPNQMIKTYESGAIAKDAENMIKNILSM